MVYDTILSFAALISSTIAGVLGVGGGMMLIALVPFFLPAEAIIPVHGASQLASNVSRTAFSRQAVLWPLLPPFLLGSCVGIVLAWFLLRHLALAWLPLAIGIYMLAMLWLPAVKSRLSRFSDARIIGALQTGLGTFVGATGPLTMALTLRFTNEKDAIVATNALFMSVSHAAKIALFFVLGFNYSQYWQTILGMTIGATMGSFIGKRLRDRVDGKRFLSLLKLVLTVLAIKMIAQAIFYQ